MKYKQLVTSTYLEAEDLLNKAAEEGWTLVTSAVVSGSLLFYLQK